MININRKLRMIHLTQHWNQIVRLVCYYSQQKKTHYNSRCVPSFQMTSDLPQSSWSTTQPCQHSPGCTAPCLWYKRMPNFPWPIQICISRCFSLVTFTLTHWFIPAKDATSMSPATPATNMFVVDITSVCILVDPSTPKTLQRWKISKCNPGFESLSKKAKRIGV